MARRTTNPLVQAELSRFEEAPAGMDGVVYRRHDAEGRLLYVGSVMAVNFRDRACQHGRESLWVQFAASGTNTWFEKRSEALRVEAEAIRTELPLFNRYHSAPGASKRLAAYLALQGRDDLLLLTADWIWGFGHRGKPYRFERKFLHR